MISSLVTRASAAFLGVGGFAMLFAADNILPRLIPTLQPADTWIGQLIAASWLGVAALNWLNRNQLLGGIYGRPVASANTLLYFVSAMSMVKLVMRPTTPAAVWIVALPMAIFAVIYLWLLFRGPVASDLEAFGRKGDNRG